MSRKRGSRPPTLLTLAKRAVVHHNLFRRGDRVACACSGGPDSTALLHALALLRKQRGHELIAVGVDHGLRAAAAGELDLVEALAASLEVPFVRVQVAVDPGSNLQARARRARHQALQHAAEDAEASVIALGHTASDRAETVLLRLLRGAGPKGLSAMPVAAPAPLGGACPLVRPLIQADRDDVRAHLERHRLASAEDPSNRDARFLRVRVRHELLPLLRLLSPGIEGHLCHLAEALDREDRDPWAALNRAQRTAIAKLIDAGAGRTTVRLSGDRLLELRLSRKKPVLSRDR